MFFIKFKTLNEKIKNYEYIFFQNKPIKVNKSTCSKLVTILLYIISKEIKIKLYKKRKIKFRIYQKEIFTQISNYKFPMLLSTSKINKPKIII